MALFTYQGTGVSGERLSGEVEAATRAEALRNLTRSRIQPLMLAAREDTPAKNSANTFSRTIREAEQPRGNVRLSRTQIVLFTDELADLLHSGLQLEPALQVMENREERSPIKTVSAFLREKLRDGTSFAEALRQASPSFGELYCNLVAAGEVSGALAPLLRRQSEHLIAMQELRGRISMALMYPAFLVAGGIAAVALVMTVLVPQMTKLLTTTGGSLPWATWLLVSVSHWAQAYALFVLAGAVLLGVLFVGAINQPAGRRWWDEAKLRVPLFGPLLSSFFYAQFCQTMANLLQNGLPLLTSLQLTTRATGNRFFHENLERLTRLIGDGASLTRAMKNVGYFPASLRDLVKVGEQTGELGETLKKIGGRFDKGIQASIEKIMSLVPLIVISVLGAMVFLIAYSMLSGIFMAMKNMQLQMHH